MRARAILPILAGLVATAVLGGPGAGTAGAAFTTPEYETTFNDGGVIGQAVGVAVDEATHDVYVADQANRRIEKFDSEGNLLFMFGDGVNETTGGDKCPVSPSDSCGPGQQSSPTFPDFTNPSAISVDNSGSPSKGDVYVAEGTGTKDPGWGSPSSTRRPARAGLGHGGDAGRPAPLKMTVSQFTGDVWILDGYVTTG